LTPRFMRHLHLFNVPDPSTDTMIKIFNSIMESFLKVNSFSDEVKKFGQYAVTGTIDLYMQIQEKLKPIPIKFHYTFNLRDVSKVFQGMLMTKAKSVLKAEVFTKLWLHEASRVFNDRLINKEDRLVFQELAMELLRAKFKMTNWTEEEVFEKNPVIFSSIMKLEADEVLYEEITDKRKLHKVLEDQLGLYNITF